MHNDEFEAYFRKVPRFIPKISYLKEPEEYNTRPIIFRKHIYSALWFIWLLGILEIIKMLHELKILPALFYIY